MYFFSPFQFDMMEDFFKAEGSRKIMFFYQDVAKGNSDKKKLFITPGDAEVSDIFFFYYANA